ncbi:MAG TPA: restriction endonuclease subunit S [Azonexus sp.]|jgi:type I restriction enzyme, S subunit|nr:restriction endonuclease subunit S [Azonexus sp.]
MSRWNSVRLSDIAIQGQYGLNAAAMKEGQGVRFVRITDIDEHCELRSDGAAYVPTSTENLDSYLLESGDLLIARSGATAGKSLLFKGLDEPAVFAGYLIRFKLDTSRALPDFVGYFFKSNIYWNYINATKRVAAQPNVNAKELASLPVPLPPLPEQCRIVDLLSRAEGIVRLRREAEKKAAELIPALFLDMFGDPATNPKGWAVVPVSSICNKCSTTDPKKASQAGFIYIDIAAIDNGRGVIVDPKPLVGAEAPSRARQVVKAGDVIFSTVRPNLRGSAMVPNELDGQICSTGFCVLRPNAATTSAFVYAFARSDWFVEEMMKKVRGAQYPAVTDKDLFGHSIPIPPIVIQQQFSARFDEVVAIQSQQSAATAKAQAAFDALLASVFNDRGGN